MTEIWKSIEGYEGIYQVSNFGRVRAKKVGFYKQKALTNKNPYLIVTLYKNNIGTTLYVHRLVLAAFVGKSPSAEHECRHLDGNPHNNNVDNLEWGTPSENAQDTIRMGRRYQPDCSGEKHGANKLTEDMVEQIRNLRGLKTQKEIARMFGVNQSTVSAVQRRASWRHV